MMLLAPALTLALAIPGQTPITPTLPTQAPAQLTASQATMRPLPPSPLAPEGAEVWHLTLPEAIRLGLINSEVVRVVATGTRGVLPAGFTDSNVANPGVPTRITVGNEERILSTPAGRNNADIVISRLNADASIWRFKSAIMAHIRSIEQQYWALSQQQINLWSRETAVRIGGELLAVAKVGLAQGQIKPAAVAEAEQQLENFKLNLVTATSDLITTERQLRNILGLPASDNRRIVPATAPTEDKLEPDWDASVKQMFASQPDIAQQREVISGMAFLAAIAPKVAAADAEVQDRRGRERQQDFLQQTVHETTHSLARFFLEIDANFKQFRAAQQARAAAQERLEVQRAAFERGEVTIDRVLDAVSQYANGIAQEAQYKTSYNTSIAAFEEAKGTLLAFDGVTVTLTLTPVKSSPADAPAPVAQPASTPAPATTYKVHASVGGWNLLNVEVEINRPTPAPR